MASRHIHPPLTDDVIERHQFYAKVSCELEETNIDIDGLGRKTSAIFTRLDGVNDTVNTYSTRGNTILACISALWLMLGSGLTMYVNSIIEQAKHTVATVHELETKIAAIETLNTANAPAIESIEKIKRNLATLQKELDEKHQ
jgi:hypothetical protein